MKWLLDEWNLFWQWAVTRTIYLTVTSHPWIIQETFQIPHTIILANRGKKYSYFSFDSWPFRRPVSHSFPSRQDKPIKSDGQSLDQIAAPERHPEKENWRWDMSLAVASAWQVKIAGIASGKLTAWNSQNWFWVQQQVWVWKWPQESLSHFKRGS